MYCHCESIKSSPNPIVRLNVGRSELWRRQSTVDANPLYAGVLWNGRTTKMVFNKQMSTVPYVNCDKISSLSEGKFRASLSKSLTLASTAHRDDRVAWPHPSVGFH